jgi:hypothetical protein
VKETIDIVTEGGAAITLLVGASTTRGEDIGNKNVSLRETLETCEAWKIVRKTSGGVLGGKLEIRGTAFCNTAGIVGVANDGIEGLQETKDNDAKGRLGFIKHKTFEKEDNSFTNLEDIVNSELMSSLMSSKKLESLQSYDDTG